MKVQVISKLWDISKKATNRTLQNIWISNGNIYATDSYILFRIKSNEFKQDDNGILDTNAILKFKNSELVALHDYLILDIDCKFPEVDKIIDEPKASETNFSNFNPDYMIKVQQVFNAFRYNRHDIVYPAITIDNPYLRFSWSNDYYTVDAVLMMVKDI